jgi:hypothetical protein
MDSVLELLMILLEFEYWSMAMLIHILMAILLMDIDELFTLGVDGAIVDELF